jgi:hypothetical protein
MGMGLLPPFMRLGMMARLVSMVLQITIFFLVQIEH